MVLQRGLQNGHSGQSAAAPSIPRSHIGQRTLFIGRSRRGPGTFPRTLAAPLAVCRGPGTGLAALGGRAVAARRAALGGLALLLLRLGGTLVRLAAVVGLVEPRPLEQDGRPRPVNAAQF